MKTADVREALGSLDSDIRMSWGEIRPILGGQSYWTFAVEPGCTFRFPKDETIAEQLRNEVRLLSELRESISFEVPQFEWLGQHRGLPFVGYRSVPGRPLTAADLSMSGTGPAQQRANARKRLSDVLAELHGFPKQRVARLLGVRNGVEAWARRYQELGAEVEADVLPLLEPGLRADVERATARFMSDGLLHFCHPVLVHCDLGSEHILVSDTTGLTCGVIDFEEATLGDPVIDFVGLWISHGAEVTGDVLARYGGAHDSGFGERLHFYQWMGSVHAILHGLQTRDPAVVSEGIAKLESRITRPAHGDRF